jgi:hypothetical protein
LLTAHDSIAAPRRHTKGNVAYFGLPWMMRLIAFTTDAGPADMLALPYSQRGNVWAISSAESS